MPPHDVHIYGTEPDEHQLSIISSLRDKILASSEYLSHSAEAASYLTDQVFHRFLSARNYKFDKSLALIKHHLVWRFETYRPFEIRAKHVEKYALKGSVQVSPRGHDAYNRPIIILDDSKDHVLISDPKLKQREAMKHLVFNIELASHLLQDNVKRYVVFINLQDFSLFSAPTIATTKETINILTHQYPERLGTAILYKAPWMFSRLFDAVKGFIDKVTREKIIFISGDTKEGSKNDLKLKDLLGENWRGLTGVDMDIYEKDGSRGYKHSVYWKTVEEREKTIFGETQTQTEQKDSNTENKEQNQTQETTLEKEEVKSEEIGKTQQLVEKEDETEVKVLTKQEDKVEESELQ